MYLIDINKLYDIVHVNMYGDVDSLLNDVQTVFRQGTNFNESVLSTLIEPSFLQELEALKDPSVSIYFRNTLREIKLVYNDGRRNLEIFVMCIGPKKLKIFDVGFPPGPLLKREYSSIKELIISVKCQVEALQKYLDELLDIDTFCTVLEPIKPTYKDDYRRIEIAHRIWLHVEVQLDGTARNIHILGNAEKWNEKLQNLSIWDYNKDIVNNVDNIHDIINVSISDSKPESETQKSQEPRTEIVCCICLCSVLPDQPGIPQPLCFESTCEANFHRGCLYQWLVTCAGGREPTFGGASGACPSCLRPIVCSKKDLL